MSLQLALYLAIGSYAALFAAAPDWGAPPQHVKPDGQTVVAVSGGKSTGDEYLLTRTLYRDYVLTFDARRLPFTGARPRALLVVRADAKTPANRSCIFFEQFMSVPGTLDRFRLVVLGDRVRLYRNDHVCARAVVPYGTPPEQGTVGFLHYYDYGFRYENIDLVAMDAEHLPPPGELTTNVKPSGVVALRWNAPKAIADLLSFEVYRSEGTACEATTANRFGTVDAMEVSDRTVRANSSYTYRVAARIPGSKIGPASEPVTVKVGKAEPPPAPIRGKAVRRIDGSVRLSWQLPDDGRAASIRLLAADRPISIGSMAQAKIIADRLPLGQTSFLVSPGAPSHLAILLQDPGNGQPGLATVEAVPSAPEVSAGKPWPTHHPMLMYDWAQVKAARRHIAADETARKTFEQLCQSADVALSTTPAAPQEPTDTHPLMGQLVRVGQAFVLSGDDKYAKWVRDVMLSYAAIYPSWPVVNGRTKMAKTPSGLYEATKYVPLICAYDLTFDSPVYTAEDHITIERDLLRPAVELFRVRDYANKGDPRTSDLHYKCYNFQAWFDTCIGLTGLLLRDADLVEHAIDGPYGFKHLLAHDIHDDGVFWERSIGYQNFVLHALHPFLEAAYHCNLDLWRLSVPDDHNADREPLANYCVGDGDNGSKSIKLMFDSQFYVGYGDLTRAQIADSNRGPLKPNEFFRTAWVRYRDPKIAWLINRTKQKTPPPAKLHRGNVDASADIALAFDDKHLYLAGKITDDVVNNSHKEASEVWAGDALWFGLKWRNDEGGAYDFIYGLSPGNFKDTPPVAALFNRFTLTHNGASTCRYAAKRTKDGYVVEAAFPLTEFVPDAGTNASAFRPKAGDRAVVDFVIYDSDAASGATKKEKMVCWSCTTDRYDSSQGGTVVWRQGQARGKGKMIVAPVATPVPTIDGDLADWQALKPAWAQIRKGTKVLTDGTSALSGLHALFYPQPGTEEGAFDLRGQSFCNNGVLQAGCSLFPSTGFAVLRERLDEQGLPPRNAVCATLNFGPYGGGHGHPDKLSIVLYAQGKHWFPDFGSCRYGSTEKREWTSQTVSHNTLVVDGISQHPTDAHNPMWPCDSAGRQARAFLDFFHCDEVMKSASAHCDSVYAGVHLTRTMCLVGDVLFDFYETDSATEHQYDYTLHIDGPLRDTSVPLIPKDGLLGEKCGYQYVSNLRQALTDAHFASSWGEDTGKLHVAVHGAEATTVIVGEGITNNATAKMPMLILRRTCKQTLFAVVARPVTETAPEVQWLDTGSDQIIAAKTAVGDTQVLVIFNATGKPVTIDGLRAEGKLAARYAKDK